MHLFESIYIFVDCPLQLDGNSLGSSQILCTEQLIYELPEMFFHGTMLDAFWAVFQPGDGWFNSTPPPHATIDSGKRRPRALRINTNASVSRRWASAVFCRYIGTLRRNVGILQALKLASALQTTMELTNLLLWNYPCSASAGTVNGKASSNRHNIDHSLPLLPTGS